MRLRPLLGLLAAVSLAGCVTPTVIARPVCVPVKPYTRAEQDALAAELAALPPGDPLAQAMVDYARMRAAGRACAAVHP